jgi:DNA polymerase III subunit chi
VTETLFYHLERRSLDDVLPGLVERTLERGWRALIKAESADRASAIDSLLWTYNDQTFLAHAQVGDGNNPARQPVLITTEDDNANAANVLFLVGGAEPPAWNAPKDLARIVLMFDGRDELALGKARAAWKESKAAGHDATYWKEMPSGKFEKQG